MQVVSALLTNNAIAFALIILYLYAVWAFVIGGSECRRKPPPFLPFLLMTQRMYRCFNIYHLLSPHFFHFLILFRQPFEVFKN